VVVGRGGSGNHHRCPRCRAWDVARSALSLLDRARLLLGWRPYRCLACDRRFYDRSVAAGAR
jgi:hypothetical protein